MKDAMNFREGYQKFRSLPEKRDSILRSLAQVVAEARDTVRLASPHEMSSRAAFNLLTRSQRNSMLNDPYYAAFESCVLGALDQLPLALIHISCDLAEEYSEKVLKAFHKMRMVAPSVKARCLGISFQDDTWSLQLQVADMIAYCERKKLLKQQGESVDPIIEELLEILRIDDVQEREVVYRFKGGVGGIGSGQLT